jgi:hypothetical protein
MARETWWDSAYAYRRKVNSVVDQAHHYVSGQYFFSAPLDVGSIISAGKARADYNDIRVVYQPSGASEQEIMRFVASGRNRVYFPCMADIPSGIDIGSQSGAAGYAYYVYYGYASAADNAPTWANRNFPQAPYSATPRNSPTASGAFDKFLLRMNDPSGTPLPGGAGGAITSFEEACGHFYGRWTPSGYDTVQPFQPGRLDKSVFFPSGTEPYIDVDPSLGAAVADRLPDYDILEPSGGWFIDLWFKPDDLSQADSFYHYLTGARRSTTQVSTYIRWPGEKVAANDLEIYGYNANWDTNSAFSNEVWKEQWLFMRVAYDRDIGDKDRVWIRGSGVNLYYEQDDAVNPVPRGTVSTTKWFRIGNEYDEPKPNSLYGFVGWIEQVRFSTFYRDLQPSGTNTIQPPTFADPEYALYLNAEEQESTVDPASTAFVMW